MSDWVSKENLWRVGFCGDSLELMTWLSGLVTIHETVWNQDEHVLIFIVTNTDRTGTLFRSGGLAASKIYKYRLPIQPLLVDFSAPGSPSVLATCRSTSGLS